MSALLKQRDDSADKVTNVHKAEMADVNRP
jgi:hypothetical protein